MEIGVYDDNLSSNSFHIKEDFKQEPPKDYSDRKLNTECYLVYDLNVVLQTRIKINLLIAQRENSAPFAKTIDHIILNAQ